MSTVAGRVRRSSRGFTLIELMIAAVVMAMLAAIALPAYRQQVLRTHRAMARATLVDLAARMEIEALHHRAYPDSFDFHLTGSDAAMRGLDHYLITAEGQVQISADRHSLYEIRLLGADPAIARHRFTLIATAVGHQAADTRCPRLSIDSAGRRLPVAGVGPSGDCWTR